MDGDTQKFLATYVKKGGHLVIYPALPTLDLYLNPCTILKEELNIQFEKSTSSNKVDAFGIEDVFTIFREKQIFQADDGEIVSKTKTGEACGIRKIVGNGMITILGYAFGYTCDEHLQLYEKIVLSEKIRRQVKVSDPDIQFVFRKGKKYSYLFLLNYHNQKKSFTIDSKKYMLNPFSYKIIKKK
jgi:beta-galactosidase